MLGYAPEVLNFPYGSQAVVLRNYLCILIAYLMGAALADIYADPFELRDLRLKPRD